MKQEAITSTLLGYSSSLLNKRRYEMFKSLCEAILAIIILVFAFWETTISKWIIVIAAGLLLYHSFTCKKCFASPMPVKTKKK